MEAFFCCWAFKDSQDFSPSPLQRHSALLVEPDGISPTQRRFFFGVILSLSYSLVPIKRPRLSSNIVCASKSHCYTTPKPDRKIMNSEHDGYVQMTPGSVFFGNLAHESSCIAWTTKPRSHLKHEINIFVIVMAIISVILAALVLISPSSGRNGALAVL